MEKIEKGEIKMKPKWYFILGSLTLFVGAVATTIFSIFFLNFLFFLMRKHYGPMYQYRLQQIISQFPWWILILAILGLIIGIRLLKEYDFSYKKNFFYIIFAYIFAVVISAYLIDYFNLNRFFYGQGWRRFYFKEQRKNFYPDFEKNRGERRWWKNK